MFGHSNLNAEQIFFFNTYSILFGAAIIWTRILLVYILFRETVMLTNKGSVSLQTTK